MFILIISTLLKITACERQRIFNVSERTAVGHIIGYLNGTPSHGVNANFYIVYPDSTGETEEEIKKQFSLLFVEGIEIQAVKEVLRMYHQECEIWTNLSDSPDKYLAAEEVSGEIRVLRELDYERRTSYHLIAVPVENRLHGEAIHVVVVISEFAALNSEISLPPAVDNDSLPLSVISYHIISGNVNNAFRLSSKRINSILHVHLVVNGLLDREYRGQYDLTIEAVDGGDPPNSGKMLVNVTVLDANDNAPEFSQSEYSAFIPWNVSMDYVVATACATDPDLGENARVAYSIAKSSADLKLPFQIDGESGVVRVSDPKLLVPGSVYELLIVASDHGQPQPLDSTTFLTITVQKSNQLKLAFDIFWLTDSNKPEIYENVTIGHVIARIAVENAPQKSQLSVSGCDALCVKETDSSSVYLVLVCGSFDREQKSEYNLFFTMRSGEKQLLGVPVFFEVLDTNDNAPKFETSLFRLTFNRSLANHKLVRIQALDLDSGENGRIQYTLSGTNLFEIESDTGILNVRETFDCSLEEYRFRVRAEDSGTPPQSSTVDVIAQIVDSNDGPPLFTKPLYDVTVKEDTEPGTCFLKVRYRFPQ
ncbi:unnamed protein product [Litomosoides sigmodontis]|uniref:Cadherin domain-containing protein n=1 Tax=Litomosoides sigmodontis TaxID=42156 RepID=A0A3P6TNN6_LITSI|nr:unnamed protein product [Litomosoides sigmodontis]